MCSTRKGVGTMKYFSANQRGCSKKKEQLTGNPKSKDMEIPWETLDRSNQ